MRGQGMYTDALPRDVASTVEWRALLYQARQVTVPFHNAVIAVGRTKLEGDQPWLHGHTRGILSGSTHELCPHTWISNNRELVERSFDSMYMLAANVRVQ